VYTLKIIENLTQNKRTSFQYLLFKKTKMLQTKKLLPFFFAFDTKTTQKYFLV